jgi:hypothetical protein
MVSWYEITGERTNPQKAGGVQINTFYETKKKPAWLVLCKLLGMTAMVAIGFYFLLPIIPLPLWQSIAAASGVILIYVGLAFFVRPEPNRDNMGWMGGFMNDPTQYSDNVNRALWNAHCLLGPGRFIAESILDCCTLLGLTAEITAEQVNQEEMEKEQAVIERDVQRWREEAARRVEEGRQERPGGQVQLSSARYLDPDRFE